MNLSLIPHHAFILKSMQKHIASVEEQIAKIDEEMRKHSKDFEKEIELLQTIPGVGKEGVIGIVAEIGVDMDVFLSEHHLASHSGMCPGNNKRVPVKKMFKNTTGEQTSNSNTYITCMGSHTYQEKLFQGKI